MKSVIRNVYSVNIILLGKTSPFSACHIPSTPLPYLVRRLRVQSRSLRSILMYTIAAWVTSFLSPLWSCAAFGLITCDHVMLAPLAFFPLLPPRLPSFFPHPCWANFEVDGLTKSELLTNSESTYRPQNLLRSSRTCASDMKTKWKSYYHHDFRPAFYAQNNMRWGRWGS